LTVSVDEQDPPPPRSQPTGQRYGQRRLADAAFFTDDGYGFHGLNLLHDNFGRRRVQLRQFPRARDVFHHGMPAIDQQMCNEEIAPRREHLRRQ
jgi:hypothetical protein